MTTVFKKASPNHRIRTADNEIALLLDFKQKIVFLENNHKNKKADIPMVSAKMCSLYIYIYVELKTKNYIYIPNIFTATS